MTLAFTSVGQARPFTSAAQDRLHTQIKKQNSKIKNIK
jgi:hypothetical protein